MAPTDLKALQAKYQPKLLKVLPNTQQLCKIRFSPDGKILAGGSFESVVRRWDFSTEAFAELPVLGGHNGWVQAVEFHQDNKRLFSADTWGQICARPFAEKEAKPLWVVKDAHDGWINSLALSPNGKQLASCGKDRQVRISNCDDGKKEAAYTHPDDVLAVAFHPDGQSLVSGDLKGIIRQWDLKTNKSIREFDAGAMYLKDRIQDVGGVRCFTFAGNGSLMIAGGSQPKSGAFVQGANLVLTFDWRTGKVKHTFKGTTDAEGFVYDIAMHADGFLMGVSSGQPGNGRLFFLQLEAATPFLSLPIPNSHSLAARPGGSLLVVIATNGNSGGNGRNLGKNKEYPGNYSPLHVFKM